MRIVYISCVVSASLVLIFCPIATPHSLAASQVVWLYNPSGIRADGTPVADHLSGMETARRRAMMRVLVPYTARKLVTERCAKESIRKFSDALIIVAGGVGEKNMLIPLWSAGKPISKEIRLPANRERISKGTE
jgi:hypothetical protein